MPCGSHGPMCQGRVASVVRPKPLSFLSRTGYSTAKAVRGGELVRQMGHFRCLRRQQFGCFCHIACSQGSWADCLPVPLPLVIGHLLRPPQTWLSWSDGPRILIRIGRRAEDCAASIEALRLGDRVEGRRAGEAGRGPACAPFAWEPANLREMRLVPVPEEGVRLHARLLRPVTLLARQGVAVGHRLWLDLAHVGVRGEAVVAAIGPCPEIEGGLAAWSRGRFASVRDGLTICWWRGKAGRSG